MQHCHLLPIHQQAHIWTSLGLHALQNDRSRIWTLAVASVLVCSYLIGGARSQAGWRLHGKGPSWCCTPAHSHPHGQCHSAFQLPGYHVPPQAGSAAGRRRIRLTLHQHHRPRGARLEKALDTDTGSGVCSFSCRPEEVLDPGSYISTETQEPIWWELISGFITPESASELSDASEQAEPCTDRRSQGQWPLWLGCGHQVEMKEGTLVPLWLSDISEGGRGGMQWNRAKRKAMESYSHCFTYEAKPDWHSKTVCFFKTETSLTHLCFSWAEDEHSYMEHKQLDGGQEHFIPYILNIFWLYVHSA